MKTARFAATLALALMASGCAAASLYPQQDASPDGRLLAEPRDDAIDLTTLRDGRPAGSLAGGHGAAVTAAHFNAEGDRLVSGDLDGRITVWDPLLKKKLGALAGHRGAVAQFAVRRGVPDLASGSDDGTLKLWDLKAGKEVRTLAGHGGGVLCLAMSPDGRTLASGSKDATVKLWDVEAGTLLRTLERHPGAVHALEFDGPAARLAAGCSDGTIRIWDLKTGQVVRTMKAAEGPVRNLFFSADARWLVVYQHASISIWDASTGVAAVEDYLIEAALAPKTWPFRAVMEQVSRRALHQ